MGGCPCKTFTVNRGQEARLKCVQPFVFSVSDAENVLMEAELGDYLLYRDYTTDRVLLSVRYNSHIRHHRISEENGLYYLNGQPYPYLDSIVLYHRQHRLDSLKLKKQAQLSARVVRLFAHKVTSTNGNNAYTLNNESNTTVTQDAHHHHHHLNHTPYHHVYYNNNVTTEDEDDQLHHQDLNADILSTISAQSQSETTSLTNNNTIATNLLANGVANNGTIPITTETPTKQQDTITIFDNNKENKSNVSTPSNKPQNNPTISLENSIILPSQQPITTPTTTTLFDSSNNKQNVISPLPSKNNESIKNSQIDITSPNKTTINSITGTATAQYLLSPTSSNLNHKKANTASPSKICSISGISHNNNINFLSSSSSSKLKSDIAEDSDHHAISLSSWTQLDLHQHHPITNGSVLSDLNNSTVSSQASLLNDSGSSDSRIIYTEHF